jgi:hypothetical protein
MYSDKHEDEFESYSAFLARTGLEDSEESFEMFIDSHMGTP